MKGMGHVLMPRLGMSSGQGSRHHGVRAVEAVVVATTLTHAPHDSAPGISSHNRTGPTHLRRKSLTAPSGLSGLCTAPPRLYRSVVHRLYRATACVLLVALAQLTLVGSGYVCGAPMPSMNGAATGQMPDAPNMPGMQGMAATAATEPGATGESDTPPMSDGCTLPWAPTGCTLMVPCAPNAISTHRVTAIADFAFEHSAPAWDVRTPPSPIFTPDPPPPRV